MGWIIIQRTDDEDSTKVTALFLKKESVILSEQKMVLD